MKRGMFLLVLIFLVGCADYQFGKSVEEEAVEEEIVEEVKEEVQEPEIVEEVKEEVEKEITGIEIREIKKKKRPSLDKDKDYFDVCDKFKIEEDQRRNYISMHYVLLDICEKFDDMSEITGLEPYDYYLVRFNNSDKFRGVLGFYMRGTGVITITVDNPKNSLLRPTLVHELSHSYMEGLQLPLWLEEGFAEYIAGEVGGKSFYGSEYMYNLAVWSDPLRNQLVEQEVNLRYMTARHVVTKMIEYYGEEDFRKMITEIKDIQRGENEFEDGKKVWKFIEKNYGDFYDEVKEYVVADEEFLQEWYQLLYRKAVIKKN